MKRKIISLSTSVNNDVGLGEKEKEFANILSSISKAQQLRAQLKNEFEKNNTVQYCLLETGAETFELSMVYFRHFKRLADELRRRLEEQVAMYSALRRTSTASSVEATDDPKIAELKAELIRLREEMQKLSGSGALPRMEPASEQGDLERSKQQAKSLPFNADMLRSAKRQQRTPVKVNDRSAPRRTDEKLGGDSIQDVLQRALQAKFKNVRIAEKEDLDTSFDSDTLADKRRERENIARAPPVPPRPKTGRGLSVAAPKKQILTEKNS